MRRSLSLLQVWELNCKAQFVDASHKDLLLSLGAAGATALLGGGLFGGLLLLEPPARSKVGPLTALKRDFPSLFSDPHEFDQAFVDPMGNTIYRSY